MSGRKYTPETGYTSSCPWCQTISQQNKYLYGVLEIICLGKKKKKERAGQIVFSFLEIKGIFRQIVSFFF